MRPLALALGLALSASAALAVQPDEVLKDPGQERRAREISAGLRCLVCQNQSIDDSDAPLARDLRVLVRERITAGDSDKAVTSFVVQRYGDFVLLRPPVDARTLALWGAPLLILATGGFALLRRGRRRASTETVTALSAEERAELDRLLRRDA